jgi:glycerol-3-phosphate acyltransferase PlsY
MTGITAGLIAGALAYLVGSIPFGLIVSKIVRKDDIRAHGSGNIGATNVARVIGKKWGIFVLLLDCMKGLLPTLLLPKLFTADPSWQTWLPVVCGIMTVVGHMFPVWLRFKGGKGVATGLGVGLVLSWQATLVALVVFLLLFAITKQISVGSMGAAIVFCATQFVQHGSKALDEANFAVTLFSIAVPLLIIIRHRSNIVRLIKKEEPKFGDPVA